MPPHEWSGEGFEFYVNQFLPFRCWSDILTNGQFGYIAADCGIGHMWYRNAREMPVNRWLNAPYAVVGGETLEIECGGERRSLFAAPDGVSCRVFFGFGTARWRREFPGFDVTVTAFVPRACDARVFMIENAGAAEGSVLWKTDLALSGDPESAKAISIDYVNRIFSVRSNRSYIDGAHFLAAASEVPEAFVCDGAKWLRGELDDSTAYASQPVIGARYPLTRCLILSCGCCGEDELSALCQLEAVRSALDDTVDWWRALLGKFKIDGGGALEHMMNGWCQYQALACRIMGRTSVYQSGGAFGFRDQLQDAVTLILISPAYARAQICAACRHQYVEGDVMHWWHAHPAGDRGVRTRCSDDMLWLVWALCEYTEKTGDLSICADEYDYVNSAPLSDQERDRYETPVPAQNPEGVLIHALKALECCAGRCVGPHGLYLFGSGDWSDGMDRVGGESVWLTWFFAHCAERFSRLLIKLCKPDWEKWAKQAEDAGRAADSAWDGGWYLRGYWPDGVPIGGHASVCCRIDSISQSWAAFCPQASPDRVDRALESAAEQLFDREHKLIKLFTPRLKTAPALPTILKATARISGKTADSTPTAPYGWPLPACAAA